MDTAFEINVNFVVQFIEQLLCCGIKPAKVSYEAYKYTLTLLETYQHLENRQVMESAAIMLEEATKRAAIHTTQLKRTKP